MWQQAGGKTAELEKDKIVNRWIEQIRQLVPRAYADVALETGSTLDVAQKILAQKDTIRSGDGYDEIFDAFGGSFEVFRFVRENIKIAPVPGALG